MVLRLTLQEINDMRAGDIKKRLAELNVNTRGVMEKGELSKMLFENQRQQQQRNDKAEIEIPMHDVSFFDLPFPHLESEQGKSFVGIDVEIKRQIYRFVIDSGASMNLIKKQTAAQTGLDRVITDANTIGMGGSGTVAASVCLIDEVQLLPTAGSAIQRGSGLQPIRNVQFSILDNPAVLPSLSQGLLGLTFLAKLGGLVTFDFSAKVMRYGHTSVDGALFAAVPTRKIFTGLIVVDLHVNGIPGAITGMVDLGSTYTILNTRAVQLATKGAVMSLDELPASPQKVAGIDGRPVTLKIVTIEGGVRVGDFIISRPCKVYAADIAGLAAIGLPHSQPCCLLGMDILAGGGSSTSKRRGQLCLDIHGNKLYLDKSGSAE